MTEMIGYVINVQKYSNGTYYNVSLIVHGVQDGMQPISGLQISYPMLDELGIKNLVKKIYNSGYRYRVDNGGNTYVLGKNDQWIQTS